ncbi:hypothetical protein [Oerskovia merdavium]|uniref:Uncharacterized protein n=1 Tax=Oerskovia merdavium TaxID=2762227 RepID=A0ABR8U4H0_9CELL|nr:hypothetical protein [Oerskovia merdavium]MBD7982928.1 hypothetical protein [Oerskovia merdavium]
MYTTTGGDHPSFLTATEAIEDHGPFELIHHGTPAPDLTGGLADRDPWAAPGT